MSIPGWLAVERTHRAAREGRNPATGEAIHIAAGYGVKGDRRQQAEGAAK